MYRIKYALSVEWIADGAGPQSVPSAQTILFGTLNFSDLTTRTNIAAGQATGFQGVPGADAPTIGNFNTALTGSSSTPTGGMALDLSTAINANLTRIQGFATGGG